MTPQFNVTNLVVQSLQCTT